MLHDLPSRDTVLIVAALGVVSAVFVLFMVGVTRALDPYPQREADLRRLALIERPDDVVPMYVNDTAIVSVKEGQKSGPVVLNEVTWFGEVKIDLFAPGIGGTILLPTTMHEGDIVSSCAYQEIRLLNATDDTATFKFVNGGGFCGGYCWHMYQPEIYDEYIGALSAG